MFRLLSLALLAACTSTKDDTGPDKDSCTPTDWYSDADGDGYGIDVEPQQACEAPEGYVAEAGDCDDADATAFPGGTEACGGGDEDCDGLFDDADPDVTGRVTSWRDGDGDTFGNAAAEALLCTTPEGYVDNAEDCDDDHDTAYPGAPEICDALDNDCDLLVDDDDDDTVGEPTWFLDADLDTYGDPATPVEVCTAPEGYIERGGDCDDTDPLVSPVGAEVCNEIDDDCDGAVDDADAEVTGRTVFYVDADADTYGVADTFTVACFLPEGHAVEAGDCDDAEPRANPGATEVCDDLDNDCDLLTDDDDDSLDLTTALEAHPDYDGDGYGDADSFEQWCDLPEGWTLDASDCADRRDEYHPGVHDRCGDGEDPDCSGDDEVCPTTADALARLTGTTAGDAAGAAVAPAGDFDGDGHLDLVVGAFAALRVGTVAPGVVYIVQGPVTGDVPLEGAFTQVWGEETDDKVGAAVAGGHDVDGDGFDDVLFGAYGSARGGSAGTAALLRGGAVGEWGIGDADAVFLGERYADDLGYSVALAGDVSGDGMPDVVVGAPGNGAVNVDAGAVYLWSTLPTGSVVATTADVKIASSTPDEHAGWSVGTPGDLDGDGVGDLVIGSAPATGTRRVYVALGPLTTDLRLADLPVWDAEAGGSAPGAAFGAPGDTDGDGLADLLVGDPEGARLGADTGAAYLLAGPATAGGTLDGATLSIRAESLGDRVGSSVGGPGDLDGDGRAEILVGGFGEATGGERAGAVWAVPGGRTGLYLLDGSPLLMVGAGTEENLGYALSGVGDLDEDGLGDWLIGAPGRSGSAVLPGYAALVSGSAY